MLFSISIFFLLFILLIPIAVMFVYKGIYNKHIENVLNGKANGGAWVSPIFVLILSFVVEFIAIVGINSMSLLNQPTMIDATENNVMFYGENDNTIYSAFNDSVFVPQEYKLTEYEEGNFKVLNYSKIDKAQSLPDNVIVLQYNGNEKAEAVFIETTLNSADGAKATYMATKLYEKTYYIVINKNQSIENVVITAKMFSEVPDNPKGEDDLDENVIDSMEINLD